MALDKLTIINNGGLSTTSDYRVGVLTATKFVGPIEGSITATDASFSGNVSIAGTLTYEDVTNIDSIGLGTFRNGIQVLTGTATTALVVDGDARVTGILTVGSSSLTLDGTNNLVNVGTALTLGHTQGLQFHTQNLHAAGFEINNINASGVVTATTFKGNGDFVDIDVDGHTNLDNVSIAGVTTTTGAVNLGDDLNLNYNKRIKFNGARTEIFDDNNLRIDTNGTILIRKKTGYEMMAALYPDGATKLWYDASTYSNPKFETTATGVTIDGTAVAGGLDINGDIDVDGHTNLDNVSVVGVSTFSGDFNVTNAGNGGVEIETQTSRTVFRGGGGIAIYGETGQNNNALLNLYPTGSAVYSYLNFYNAAGNSVASITAHEGQNLFIDGGSNGTLRHRVYGSGFHSFQEGNTERLRIKANGAIGLSGANYGSSGQVLTSQGSGSAVTWSTITGTTINNNANNRVITGSGTANTLEGEANLTFDGNDLRIDHGDTIDGILGKAYTGYFGLKHADQTLDSEYMIISNDSHTFISASSGKQVRIRYGGNDSTNELQVNTGVDGLTWRGSKIFHAGNDGSGSGLDSDTLDGVQGSSFLRSDATDTCSGQITHTNKVIIDHNSGTMLELKPQNASPWVIGINRDDLTESRVFVHDTNGLGWVFEHKPKWYDSGGYRNFLTTADTGTGNGLDADLWDGNQFSSYLNQAVKTNSNVTFDRIDIAGSHGMDNTGWYRNDNSGQGLYNTSTGQHFYSDDDDYWNIGGGTGANGLRFRDEHNGTIRGYVYANSSNQIGFLDQNSNWALRTTSAGITKLGSNGYQLVNGNNANNLYIYSGTASATGISMFNNSSQWRFQIYGDGTSYGFLDGNWAGWDLKKTVNGNFEVDEGNGLARVWNSLNDGSGSGLDADYLDGLHAHTGRNNEANKVVRTDGNGYIQAGWINTDSGDTGTGSDCVRFYASQDNYLRYIDRGSMRSVMNVSSVSSVFPGREDYTTDSNYWTGAMGWGSANFDTSVWDYGSCFFDVWSNPSGQPSGTSHWTGFQAMHYTNNNTRYGCRITVGAGNPYDAYIQGRWGSTTNGWYRLWNESNDHLLFSTTHNQTDQLQLKMHTNSWNGGIKFISNDGNNVSQLHMDNSGTYDLMVDSAFYTGGHIRANGDIIPHTNDDRDLGQSGLRWRNIYTTDLQLSNESKKDKGGNDVDGTWGDYTIQEGEDDLFLINNRSGKKYKFMLQEVK